MAKVKSVNLLALARKEKGMMSALLPAVEGNVFVSVDLCFPADTEILTPAGFIKFSDLKPDLQVWQVDPQSLEGSWVRPSRIIDRLYTGDMVNYDNRYGGFQVTAGHTMLWAGQVNHKRADKALRRHVTKAGDGAEVSADHFIHFTTSKEAAPNDITDAHIWLACALHADSWYDVKRDKYNIEVAKPRKVEKLRQLLDDAGCKYPVRPGHNLPTVKWNYLDFTSPLLQGKEFLLAGLSTLTTPQIAVFVEALQFWDGEYVARHSDRSNRFTWGQMNRAEVEKVQQFLVTHGYGAALTADANGFSKLSIRKTSVTRLKLKDSQLDGRTLKASSITATHVVDFRVGCVTVPSGFILVRQNGRAFVSGNCSGEPSCTTHFSKDPMYRYACFDGIGKAPYYGSYKEHASVLFIDDVYLMVASISPFGKNEIREAFGKTYNGLSFSEQWLKDPEVIKSGLKQIRQLNKVLTLAASYGMGPRKMTKTAFENGHTLSIQDAKKFFTAYWSLFEGLAKLARHLEGEFNRKGYLINPFGYRIVPGKDEGFKCLNFYVQSSVSGIMHVLMMKFCSVAQYARIVTVIHDELVIECPTDRVEEARIAMAQAVQSLNEDLGWSVAIRTGWAVGSNLYESK